MSDEPHSADAFGESRDHWWHSDFLELMAKRWGLASARRGLDVGSGQGHWSRLMVRLMHPDATLVGVEPEPKWVEEATAGAKAAGLADRLSHRAGSAEEIPFDDRTFDFVTCQTVLMHVADPEAALREMWRVLSPGGLLLAVEPNNRVGTLILHSVDLDRSADDIADEVRCDLIRERGKRALGRGDDSVGDRIPGLFYDLGVEDLRVHLSDNTWPMNPPYEGALAKAVIEELRVQVERGRHYWRAEEVREWFLEGGGTEQDFERWWERMLARDRSIVEAADAGTYRSPGGGVFYLVSGRKPA